MIDTINLITYIKTNYYRCDKKYLKNIYTIFYNIFTEINNNEIFLYKNLNSIQVDTKTLNIHIIEFSRKWLIKKEKLFKYIIMDINKLFNKFTHDISFNKKNINDILFHLNYELSILLM